MNVVAKVHFSGCPLEVTFHMRLSGDLSGIEEKAASEAHNNLKSGDTGSPLRVKLPEDRQYYIVVTPAEQIPIEGCSEDAYECDVYFIEALEETVQVQELLRRLRAEFKLREEIVNELSPLLTTSLCSDYEQRTFNYMQDMSYPPGSTFLAVNDRNRSGSYSSSRSISPQIYNTFAFGKALRESVVDTESPGKDHSMVCMPPKPSLPLLQETTPKLDLTRRDPITAQPPPTPDNLARAPIRLHQKFLGGTALHELHAFETPVDTPTVKFPGILHQRDAYGLATPTGLQGTTTVANTPHTVTSHFPLRLEAEGGGQQVGERVQEETSTAEVEEEEVPLNQENKGEENEPNCQPVSECSQSDDRLSSSPHAQSSPRDQLTHGQNFSRVGGMVPGIESRIPLESNATKTRSNVSNVAMAKERSGLFPDQQSDIIHRVRSAPEFCTQPAIPTAVGSVSLVHPEHRETSKASHESNNHTSAVDASSSFHVKQLVRQESDQGVLFDACPPEVNVVEAVEGSENVGTREEEEVEVVMVGKPVFGGDRLQVPSLQFGKRKTKKQKRIMSEAKSPNAPTVPQDVMDSELKNLHALEHACNGQEGSCHLGKEENVELCSRLYDRQLVEDMESQIAAYQRGGKLSDQVKKLIRRHCLFCRDSECRVPHLAAGCLPAGQNHTPTTSPLASTTSTAPSSTAPSSPAPSTDPASKSEANNDEIQGNAHYMGIGIASPSFDLQPAHDSRIPDDNLIPHNRFSDPPPSPFPALRPTDHPDSPVHLVARTSTYHVLPAEMAFVATNVYFKGANPPYRNSVLEQPYQPGHMNIPVINAIQTSRECHQGVQATDDQPEAACLHYLQPNAPVEAHKNMRMQPACHDHCFPDVTFNEFPTTPNFTPKTIVYSCQPQLIPGSEAHMPDMNKVSNANTLGKGGNGKTFKYPLLNKEFAVKFTHYRSNELNLWHKFDHPNVVKLLVVMMGPDSRCFQFMPRMGDNLRTVICRGHPICSLYDQHNTAEWTDVIMPNARHIVRSMVEGTRYLHSQNVQHCDLKASNILTEKQCNCRDIIHCKCPQDKKCLVRLADFDSAKSIKSPMSGPLLCIPKSSDECGKVMGTPGYRAPEQFMKPAPVVPVNSTDSVLEGTMADIWSLGITFLSLFVGPNKAEDKHKAWILACQPNHTEFSRTNIQSELIHAYVKLVTLCTSEPRRAFDSASQFAKCCLEPDFRQRPEAKDLLNHKFFTEL